MRNIIRNTALILLTCIFSLVANGAQALIVESASKAMSRGFFETGFVPGAQNSSHEEANANDDSQRKTYNYNYDYSKDIANKLLNTGNEGSLVLVDMVDDYRTSLSVSKGQFVAVRLTEDDDAKWNFENRSNGLQFVKREKRGDVVILLYKAVKSGFTTVNLDLLSTGAQVKALEAKVLELRVI